jgi:predicted small secreted protein
MNKAMKTLPAASVLLLILASMLSACNTVKGVGKDIEKAGEVIQRGADK